MNNQFFNDFQLRGSKKEEWERHLFLLELFEKGIELEEIAKIAGLSEEEMDEHFPRLY